MVHTTSHRRLLPTATVALAALVLGACSTTPAAEETAPTTTTTAETEHDGEHHEEGEEVEEPTGRVALTYDGGLLVLDATSLETLADIPLDGFNRLNSAGDTRHVLVSTSGGFQALDTGAWAEAHGDHAHHFVGEPALTDLVFEATTPGHVVRHAGRTVLFDDGTGDITSFVTEDLLEAEQLPATEVVQSAEAHHGVAIILEDDTLLATIGTPDARTGVRVLDASRTEVARNEECPSVHGEGAAKDEHAVFGCSDGALLYANGEFTKLTSPTEYGRIGNMYVLDDSPIAVGDYNSDPDSEGYLLTELALIDTEARTLVKKDLPDGVSYTWRGVGRAPSGEALVLSSDGSLYVLDEATGEQKASYPVIDAWEGPVEWQDPHPALSVLGDVAYITEPATRTIHAVDIATGTVLTSASLTQVPNEIAVVTG